MQEKKSSENKNEAKIELLNYEVEREKERQLIKRHFWKFLAIVIVFIFIGNAVKFGSAGVTSALVLVLVPMALIFFSDYISRMPFSGSIISGSPIKRIDQPSPAIALKLLGWFLLILAIVRFNIIY